MEINTIAQSQARSVEGITASSDITSDYFRESSPKIMELISAYYQHLNDKGIPEYIIRSIDVDDDNRADDILFEVPGQHGPSHELNNLEINHDIDLASNYYLDAIGKQIAYNIPNPNYKSGESPLDKRRLYKLIVKYYNARGSDDSVYAFFRIFYNEIVTLIFPKDLLFDTSGKRSITSFIDISKIEEGDEIIDHGGIGEYEALDQNRFVIRDSERWQEYSYVIKPDSLTDTRWLDEYLRFVHPAGLKLIVTLAILAGKSEDILYNSALNDWLVTEDKPITYYLNNAGNDLYNADNLDPCDYWKYFDWDKLLGQFNPRFQACTDRDVYYLIKALRLGPQEFHYITEIKTSSAYLNLKNISDYEARAIIFLVTLGFISTNRINQLRYFHDWYNNRGKWRDASAYGDGYAHFILGTAQDFNPNDFYEFKGLATQIDGIEPVIPITSAIVYDEEYDPCATNWISGDPNANEQRSLSFFNQQFNVGNILSGITDIFTDPESGETLRRCRDISLRVPIRYKVNTENTFNTYAVSPSSGQILNNITTPPYEARIVYELSVTSFEIPDTQTGLSFKEVPFQTFQIFDGIPNLLNEVALNFEFYGSVALDENVVDPSVDSNITLSPTQEQLLSQYIYEAPELTLTYDADTDQFNITSSSGSQTNFSDYLNSYVTQDNREDVIGVELFDYVDCALKITNFEINLAATGSGPYYEGDIITYRADITNTSAATINNIQLTPTYDGADPSSFDPITVNLDTNALFYDYLISLGRPIGDTIPANIGPGETLTAKWRYQLAAGDVNNNVGLYITSSAPGMTDDISNTLSVFCDIPLTPAFSVVNKHINPDNKTEFVAGDFVTYETIITSTGNVNVNDLILSTDISPHTFTRTIITSPLDPSNYNPNLFAGGISLAPGDIARIQYSYEIDEQGVIDHGFYLRNEITVSSSNAGSNVQTFTANGINLNVAPLDGPDIAMLEYTITDSTPGSTDYITLPFFAGAGGDVQIEHPDGTRTLLTIDPFTRNPLIYPIDDGTLDPTYEYHAPALSQLGKHIVKFDGSVDRWYQRSERTQYRLTRIIQWGQLGATRIRLNYAYGLGGTTLPNNIESSVIDLAYLFYNWRSDRYGPVPNIENLNISNVTNLNRAFAYIDRYNSNNIDGFNQNLDAWDFSNVTNMREMFSYTRFWNNGDDPGDSTKPLNWNVSNVTDFQNMFRDTASFNQDISSWTIGTSLTTMAYMFYNATVFSSANYEAFLVKLADTVVNTNGGLPTNVSFTSTYPEYTTIAADNIRNELVTTYNWIIDDDGPMEPTNLVATVNSENNINLTWTINSTDETQFEIERKIYRIYDENEPDAIEEAIAALQTGEQTGWINIGSAPAGTSQYTDDYLLIPNRGYIYRIKAVNAGAPAGYTDTSWTQSQPSSGIEIVEPTGEQIFEAFNPYFAAAGILLSRHGTFTVPNNVYAVHVLCVGSGDGYGIDSIFGDGSLVRATGSLGTTPGQGYYDPTDNTGLWNVSELGGGHSGGGGVTTISNQSLGGAGTGGGAAGYSGKGGNAVRNGRSNALAGEDGQGGGGAGAATRYDFAQTASGGGVGLYGEGANGIGKVADEGGGGSGGQDGRAIANGSGPVMGGSYGGGAAGRSGEFWGPEFDGSGGGGLAWRNFIYVSPGDQIPITLGANGAVRIIWGPGRSFPSTNVGPSDNMYITKI